MKKIIVLVVMVAMMATSFVGCAKGDGSSTADSGNKQTAQTETSETAVTQGDSAVEPEQDAEKGPIGIVIPAADHGWIAGVVYYAEQKCKELGLEEGNGYKLAASANVNEQANQIEEMITLGCSAIVLLPHNDEVSVSADKIIAAGIPLIIFDRKINGEYTAYVGGNNKAIGTVGAQYLGEALGGKGTIAVMNAPSVGSVSIERTDGFKEVMSAQYPDIALIDVTADGFTQEAGLKMATDMLVANPKIDAVFSIDDEPSLGILQAIKDAKRTDVKYISGGGGSQNWYSKIQSETDTYCFTETYSPAMIGNAIEVANDIVDGEEFQKDTIVEPTTVTKQNVEGLIDTASPY